MRDGKSTQLERKRSTRRYACNAHPLLDDVEFLKIRASYLAKCAYSPNIALTSRPLLPGLQVVCTVVWPTPLSQRLPVSLFSLGLISRFAPPGGCLRCPT